MYTDIVEKGGEGVMFKHRLAKYYEDKRHTNVWVKWKKSITEDVVIIGYTEGKGKYDGLIGAVVYGSYIEGTLTEIGQCSGMDDATRVLISENQDSMIGRVIEVEAHEKTKNNSLKEPRFIRFRDDKFPIDCVWTPIR